MMSREQVITRAEALLEKAEQVVGRYPETAKVYALMAHSYLKLAGYK